MITRWILAGSLVLATLPIAYAQPGERFSCTAGYLQYSILGDVEASTGGSGNDTATLMLSKAGPFTGRFLRESHGTWVVHKVTGHLPAVITAVRQESMTGIDYDGDITGQFSGDFSSADTRIVVVFSRPELPQATFAATVTLWAEFADGRRSMVAKAVGGYFQTASDPLNCETL